MSDTAAAMLAFGVGSIIGQVLAYVLLGWWERRKP